MNFVAIARKERKTQADCSLYTTKLLITMLLLVVVYFFRVKMILVLSVEGFILQIRDLFKFCYTLQTG